MPVETPYIIPPIPQILKQIHLVCTSIKVMDKSKDVAIPTEFWPNALVSFFAK